MSEEDRQDEYAPEDAAQTSEEMLAGHDARVGLVHRYEQEWLQVGKALDWIRKKETYKLKGFTSFRAFLREEFPNISAATAWRWIADSQTYDEVKASSIEESESNVLDSLNEAQNYALSRSLPGMRADVLREVASEAAASNSPLTSQLIQSKIRETQGNGDKTETARKKKKQSHATAETERHQQAHIFATACKTAALTYCKVMEFDDSFATQVYNQNLSVARNLEATEAEDEATFRQTEEGANVAGGTYICQQCCTAGETQELNVAPDCPACSIQMVWHGDIPDLDALLKSLAQLRDSPEEGLISGLEIGDKKPRATNPPCANQYHNRDHANWHGLDCLR